MHIGIKLINLLWKGYDTVLELYSAYSSFIDLAVNPQGSLQSFNEDRRDRDNKFIELYNRVESQIQDDIKD